MNYTYYTVYLNTPILCSSKKYVLDLLFQEFQFCEQKMTECSDEIAANAQTNIVIASSVSASIVVVFLTILLIIIRRDRPRNKSSFLKKENQHVIITGGSSGIGLSLARECASYKRTDGRPFFSHITLIARNQSKLEKAQKDVQAIVGKNWNSSAKIVVTIVSADISNYALISEALTNEIIGKYIPPTLFFNVAGTAIPCRFLESDPKIFSELMSTNYLGTVNTTRVIAPHMTSNGGGTIILTSSAAGQVGIYGYTAYSPTKFALRGFAESLLMELAPFDVHVQIAFPPNTDTPGFEKENQFKMEECKFMEDGAGLFQPDE